MASVKCVKGCGRDINPYDISTWKEVTGFVGGPKKDSMVLRSDTGRYACSPCIHREKAGQAPDQESLFDEDNHDELVYASGYKAGFDSNPPASTTWSYLEGWYKGKADRESGKKPNLPGSLMPGVDISEVEKFLEGESDDT